MCNFQLPIRIYRNICLFSFQIPNLLESVKEDLKTETVHGEQETGESEVSTCSETVLSVSNSTCFKTNLKRFYAVDV